MKSAPLMLGLMLTVSCTESIKVTPAAVNDTAQSTPSADMVTLDLSAHGNLKEMSVPARKSQGVDPSISIDDVTGYVSVTIGRGFQLLIREEPTSLQDIRQEMENEMMWENKILASDSESMLIERSLPDGSMSQYHFTAVMASAGSNIVLRSNPMGEFNQKQAERMLECAKTLTISTDLTARN